MDGTAPLINRPPEDYIAYLNSSSRAVGVKTGPVTVGDFISQVRVLAERLPSASFALNLCENRYLFMLGFCAAILREQTNLLPPNKTPETQKVLSQRYDSSYVLHDGIALGEELRSFDISTCDLSPTEQSILLRKAPDIQLDFLAAITFTSGSTGESKPNLKSWRTFVVSTDINAQYMLSDKYLMWQLATVPGQHMWGMETSVLLPLMKRVCVCDTRPLFPKDICTLLQELPEPRMLVSTPVHLRAMVMSGLDFPSVDTILCATAPLTLELASEVESSFKGRLQEIYGCSEVGSMSYRRTAQEELWSIFDGIDFSQDGEFCHASGDHLPESIILQDRMERIGDQQFRLIGRNEDMIEIAGKRGSLAEMNKILLSVSGVIDGVVFQSQSRHGVARVVALVVLMDGTAKADVLEKFRSSLDPVFVPRPIYAVSALPREENGKLIKARLQKFYQSLKNV